MSKPVSVIEKVFQEVKAGLVSSVAAEAALFPLDSVKLRQQVYGGTAAQVFRRILKEQGVGGLYQGLFGRCFQTITSNVGFFIWQTIFVQVALQRVQDGKNAPTQLSTGLSLLVNMLAQQFNRVLTTPVDVAANVHQADPHSLGFFQTFVRLARTGGRRVLWRGLAVSLLLSLNPALMYTLVGKLTAFVSRLHNNHGPLDAKDMFWISGISKAVATVVTYPLIRAKAVQQTTGADSGLWPMLSDIARKEGISGLYSGCLIMSYKTVLFNSLMMALKQKVSMLLGHIRPPRGASKTNKALLSAGRWRNKVMLVGGKEMPWVEAEENSQTVVYVDGSWSFLHKAQEHFLKEAARRGDHLIVGVHSDACHMSAVGSWPAECYAARKGRIEAHPNVTSILEDAPWDITEELIKQLGISKVLGGTITKAQDCAGPPTPLPGTPNSKCSESPHLKMDSQEVMLPETSHAPAGKGQENGVAKDPASVVNGMERQITPTKRQKGGDPYAVCRQLGIFEQVESLNDFTEHDVWLKKVSKIVFSNVDASIDWRILVKDDAKGVWGKNPGYSASSS